jgi:ribosomal protein S18 acetylase RimI-like enzyme
MSIPWLVRPAGRDDAEILARLESEAFGPASWGAESVQRGLGAPLVSALLVCRLVDLPPEGFALWRRLVDEGELLSIGVKRGSRRLGAADALMDAVIADAGAEGLGAVVLEVDAANLAARALYAKHDFRKVGERRAYYRNGADALVLRRRL